jgi:hypothetical protein
MTLEIILAALGWSILINFAVLLAWGLGFILAHDWMYKMHSRLFKLTPGQFDTIHYTGMLFFKLCILIFNLVPYLALRIAG